MVAPGTWTVSRTGSADVSAPSTSAPGGANPGKAPRSVAKSSRPSRAQIRKKLFSASSPCVSRRISCSTRAPPSACRSSANSGMSSLRSSSIRSCSEWHGYENLGGDLRSSPSCVSRRPDRIDCFARGQQKRVYRKWWDGSSWHGWTDLGSSIQGPRTASRAPRDPRSRRASSSARYGPSAAAP